MNDRSTTCLPSITTIPLFYPSIWVCSVPSLSSLLPFLPFFLPFFLFLSPPMHPSCAFAKTRSSTRGKTKKNTPHIAYLLSLFMDWSVTYLNIVRGIKNQRPRQPVQSTLLASISALGGLIVTNIFFVLQMNFFLFRVRRRGGRYGGW